MDNSIGFLDVILNFCYNIRIENAWISKWQCFWKFCNISYRFIFKTHMKKWSQIIIENNKQTILIHLRFQRSAEIAFGGHVGHLQNWNIAWIWLQNRKLHIKLCQVQSLLRWWAKRWQRLILNNSYIHVYLMKGHGACQNNFWKNTCAIIMFVGHMVGFLTRYQDLWLFNITGQMSRSQGHQVTLTMK